MRIRCRRAVVERSIDFLQEAGHRGTECVVLWLACRPADDALVVEAYRPEQIAEHHRFIIPRNGMRALMRHVRDHRLSLLAQVHSHPEEAFHSWVDDREAIVRHNGALSIVASYFGHNLTAESFSDACAFFTLNSADRWVKLSASEIDAYFEMVP